MITETTGRDEVKAMESKYKQVLAWEEEFAKEIEELKKIDEQDKEANKVALELLKAWQDRKHIKSSGKKANIALASNGRKIDRLEEKLKTLGYELIKSDWNNDIKVNKL
jgi:chaperonin cofactor prefoldin